MPNVTHELPDVPFIVTTRVRDAIAVAPGSVEAGCWNCGDKVWIAPDTGEHLRKGFDARVICTVCLPALVQKTPDQLLQGTVPITCETCGRRDLIEATGPSMNATVMAAWIDAAVSGWTGEPGHAYCPTHPNGVHA